ncbi:hypothetical protein KKHLCK_15110 [Candidatus Electrothrix laxa]
MQDKLAEFPQTIHNIKGEGERKETSSLLLQLCLIYTDNETTRHKIAIRKAVFPMAIISSRQGEVVAGILWG